MKLLSETLTELGIAFSFPIIIKDANGNSTYREYNSRFWVKREFDADGNKTYYENSDGLSFVHLPVQPLTNNTPMKKLSETLTELGIMNPVTYIKELFRKPTLGWFSVDNDFDFDYKIDGVIRGEDEVRITNLSQLENIEYLGAFGSPLSKDTKLWEVEEGVARILKNPEEGFDSTGGNRGVVWKVWKK